MEYERLNLSAATKLTAFRERRNRRKIQRTLLRPQKRGLATTGIPSIERASDKNGALEPTISKRREKKESKKERKCERVNMSTIVVNGNANDRRERAIKTER
jgi:hypothetical protein